MELVKCVDIQMSKPFLDNHRNTYLTKLRNTPMSSKPFKDVIEDLDVMMARIYKRTGKWFEWIIV